MRKIVTLTIVAIIFICLHSCSEDDKHCISPLGDIVTEEYVFQSDIKGLEIDIPADTYLKQGPSQEIVSEGHENILDLLNFHLQDEILNIGLNHHCIQSMGTLDFNVTLEDIERLSIISSGNINGENTFEVNELDMYILGSGNIDLVLDAEEIETEIIGSGKFYLEGFTEELKSTILGSGNLNAFPLTSEIAEINITGSGNVYVNVVDTLIVNISGSGNVYYKGNPVVIATITGSGKIENRN